MRNRFCPKMNSTLTHSWTPAERAERNMMIWRECVCVWSNMISEPLIQDEERTNERERVKKLQIEKLKIEFSFCCCCFCFKFVWMWPLSQCVTPNIEIFDDKKKWKSTNELSPCRRQSQYLCHYCYPNLSKWGEKKKKRKIIQKTEKHSDSKRRVECTCMWYESWEDDGYVIWSLNVSGIGIRIYVVAGWLCVKQIFI